ncbi:MAG: DUF309 domain-containing protein [Ardenticatenaceae bacterium]|nr:DUF309 domain-containing protein [Ardenticatenaceae bacterium]
MTTLKSHLQKLAEEILPAKAAWGPEVSDEYRAAACARPQPPLLARGLEQFNAGRFFEQHETLEWLWRATEEPIRDLYKGILQVGVGFYHVERGNHHGAVVKLTGGAHYLEPFTGICQGVDAAALRAAALHARNCLLQSGPAGMDELDPGLIVPVVWTPHLAEPRVTSLLRALDAAWNESGVAVEARVREVDGDEAAWMPPTGRGILDILIHLGVGKHLALAALSGSGPASAEEVEPPARELPAVESWLAEAHEALRQYIGFLQDCALDESAPACLGRPMTREQLLLATVAHDAYHAGELNQVRLLYKALRAMRAGCERSGTI